MGNGTKRLSVANISAAYGEYYKSGYYARRYPICNRSSLAFIRSCLGTEDRVLDFGCGNGRYVLPLLEERQIRIVAYDVCPDAIAGLMGRLEQHPSRERVTPVCGQSELLSDHGPFDLAIAMFGVLSHIPSRDERLGALRLIRERLKDGKKSRLLLSVPNIYRRFVGLHIKSAMRRWLATDRGSANDLDDIRDILYSRRANGTDIRLYYHLYDPEDLQADLQAAGFGNVRIHAESVLPESAVTRSSLLEMVDRALLPMTPSRLGYGLMAVAEAV